MKRLVLAIMTMAFAQASWGQMYSPNMYGTGLASAYPPCPYPQSSIAANVTKKSERFETQSNSIRRRLRTAKNKLEGYSEDSAYGQCRKDVSDMIRSLCGDGNAIRGERAVSDFDDHMRGSLFVSKNLNYEKTYLYVVKNIEHVMTTSSYDSTRLPAADPMNEAPIPLPGGDYDNSGYTPPAANVGSCVDRYTLGNGTINKAICDDAANAMPAGEASGSKYRNCRSCLSPTPSFRRGFYPQRYREIYDLQQEVAELENELEVAEAKVSCAQEYLDSGDNASGFRSCVLDADPLATAADYCLTCDENGKEKKEGVDWSKWLPGLVSAGLWTAGGFYAHNQMERTRQGNWEAGYPSDDRQPWVMTNYVMNGANQVLDTFKASGAFGCAPTGGLNGQGVMGATNMSPFMNHQFGGNPYIQMGGALGYPAGMMGAMNPQLMMGGGLYAGNPSAGPWGMQGSAGGNLAAQQAMLQQQQMQLQYMVQQGQRDLATLQAVAQLDAQLAQIQAQRNQIFASNPGFGTGGGMYGSAGMYGGGGMYGAGGGMYGGGNMGLFGNIQAQWGITGWGGVGAGGGMYGAGGGMYGGGMYGGVGTPPFVPPYTGGNPGQYVMPPTNPGGSGGNTGSAVPSLGL